MIFFPQNLKSFIYSLLQLHLSLSMPPTSPFIFYEEDLLKIIKEMPKTSAGVETSYYNIYFKLKRETDIVEKLGTKYDSPPLDGNDRCGVKARRKKQKNKMYTWVKNHIMRKTCGNVESFKEKWIRYADENPAIVMEYVTGRPCLVKKMQSIWKTDLDQYQPRENEDIFGVEAHSKENEDVFGVEAHSKENEDIFGAEAHSKKNEDVFGVEAHSKENEDVFGVEAHSKENEDIFGVEAHSKKNEDVFGVEAHSKENEDVFGVDAHSKENEDVFGVEAHSKENEDVFGVEAHSKENGDVFGVEAHSKKNENVFGVEAHAKENEDVYGVEAHSKENEDVFGVEAHSKKNEDVFGVEAHSKKNEDVFGVEAHSKKNEDVFGVEAHSKENEDGTVVENSTDVQNDNRFGNENDAPHRMQMETDDIRNQNLPAKTNRAPSSNQGLCIALSTLPPVLTKTNSPTKFKQTATHSPHTHKSSHQQNCEFDTIEMSPTKVPNLAYDITHHSDSRTSLMNTTSEISPPVALSKVASPTKLQPQNNTSNKQKNQSLDMEANKSKTNASSNSPLNKVSQNMSSQKSTDQENLYSTENFPSSELNGEYELLGENLLNSVPSTDFEQNFIDFLIHSRRKQNETKKIHNESLNDGVKPKRKCVLRKLYHDERLVKQPDLKGKELLQETVIDDPYVNRSEVSEKSQCHNVSIASQGKMEGTNMDLFCEGVDNDDNNGEQNIDDEASFISFEKVGTEDNNYDNNEEKEKNCDHDEMNGDIDDLETKKKSDEMNFDKEKIMKNYAKEHTKKLSRNEKTFGKFKCDGCGAKFRSMQRYKSHKLKCEVVRCQQCNQRFETIDELKEHAKKHDGEYVHSRESLSGISLLKRHERDDDGVTHKRKCVLRKLNHDECFIKQKDLKGNELVQETVTDDPNLNSSVETGESQCHDVSVASQGEMEETNMELSCEGVDNEDNNGEHSIGGDESVIPFEEWGSADDDYEKEEEMCDHAEMNGDIDNPKTKKKSDEMNFDKEKIQKIYDKKHAKKLCRNEKTYGKFKCDGCGAKFRSMQRYKSHKLKCEVVRCQQCNQRFESIDELKEHTKKHEGEDMHSCESLSGISLLKRHDRIAHKKKYHQLHCLYCPKTFSTKTVVRAHLKDVHQELGNMCLACSKFFDSQYDYNIHMNDHRKTKVNAFRCKKCGKSFELLYNLKKHNRRFHKAKGERICKFCLEYFPNDEAHKKHLKNHEQDKQNTCSFCRECFDTNELLNEHVRNVHSKGNMYICEICGFKADQSLGFKHHKLEHEENMQYTCEQCGKGFLLKHKLREHMVNHADDLPFVCENSDKRFKRRTTLRSHMMAHLKGKTSKFCNDNHMTKHCDERTWKCGTCEKIFQTEQQKLRHEKNHLSNKPFYCDKCDGSFSRKSKWNRHINTEKHKFNSSRLRALRKTEQQPSNLNNQTVSVIDPQNISVLEDDQSPSTIEDSLDQSVSTTEEASATMIGLQEKI